MSNGDGTSWMDMAYNFLRWASALLLGVIAWFTVRTFRTIDDLARNVARHDIEITINAKQIDANRDDIRENKNDIKDIYQRLPQKK